MVKFYDDDGNEIVDSDQLKGLGGVGKIKRVKDQLSNEQLGQLKDIAQKEDNKWVIKFIEEEQIARSNPTVGVEREEFARRVIMEELEGIGGSNLQREHKVLQERAMTDDNAPAARAFPPNTWIKSSKGVTVQGMDHCAAALVAMPDKSIWGVHMQAHGGISKDAREKFAERLVHTLVEAELEETPPRSIRVFAPRQQEQVTGNNLNGMELQRVFDKEIDKRRWRCEKVEDPVNCTDVTLFAGRPTEPILGTKVLPREINGIPEDKLDTCPLPDEKKEITPTVAARIARSKEGEAARHAQMEQIAVNVESGVMFRASSRLKIQVARPGREREVASGVLARRGRLLQSVVDCCQVTLPALQRSTPPSKGNVAPKPAEPQHSTPPTHPGRR